MKIVNTDGETAADATTYLDQISGSWTYPFATGKKYEISWGKGSFNGDKESVDFTKFTMRTSSQWLESDASILFTHKYIQERTQMYIDVAEVPIMNNSIASKSLDSEFLELG